MDYNLNIKPVQTKNLYINIVFVIIIDIKFCAKVQNFFYSLPIVHAHDIVKDNVHALFVDS